MGGTWSRLEWSLVELYQLIQVKILRRASARVAKIRPWRHSRLSDAQNKDYQTLAGFVVKQVNDWAPAIKAADVKGE